MKREELVVRLEIYKKEIYRRAYIMLFVVFLPVIITFICMGVWGNIIEHGMWAVIVFIAAFAFSLSGIILYFLYMISRSLPKKIGLICPKCNTSIIKNEVEEFLHTGACAKCGAIILED